MKSVLLLAGLLVMIAGCSWWALNGAHTGWTKTSVAIEKIDEITEIPYVVYEDQFVPGIEFPIGFMGLGLSLMGTSLWISRKQSV